MVITVNMRKKLFIIVVVMGLTACVSVDPYTQPSGPGHQSTVPVIDASGKPDEQEIIATPEAIAKPREVSEVAAAPAVVNNLLAKAKKQQRQGDLSGAMSTVERAIRIAPRYPTGYYQLAVLKFDANEFSNAKSLAQKAISLGANGSLKNSAQELVVISDNYIAQGL
jgi:tetratricopeptide (TPR) repeat protein